MPLTPEQETQKRKFIELVAALAQPPKTRAFRDTSDLQAQHAAGVAFVKAEILTDETIALLGEDYAAVKISIDTLQ